MSTVSAKIKGLNLGCRNRSIPGFLNMDCDQHDGVDIVGDISDLSRFSDSSVEQIYASHVLEHFPHTRTMGVLREWVRVLEPSGMLYVAVPDFKRTVEIYQKCGLVDWVQNYLMGDQGYKTAFHYAIFDEDRLRNMLLLAGFADTFRVDEFPIGDPKDCSHGVSNVDLEPVSLNFQAVR